MYNLLYKSMRYNLLPVTAKAKPMSSSSSSAKHGQPLGG